MLHRIPNPSLNDSLKILYLTITAGATSAVAALWLSNADQREKTLKTTAEGTLVTGVTAGIILLTATLLHYAAGTQQANQSSLTRPQTVSLFLTGSLLTLGGGVAASFRQTDIPWTAMLEINTAGLILFAALLLSLAAAQKLYQYCQGSFFLPETQPNDQTVHDPLPNGISTPKAKTLTRVTRNSDSSSEDESRYLHCRLIVNDQQEADAKRSFSSV